MRDAKPEETRGTRIGSTIAATTDATIAATTDATIVAIEGTRTKMKANQKSLLKIVKAKNDLPEIIGNPYQLILDKKFH